MKKHSMTTRFGSFPKEHRHVFEKFKKIQFSKSKSNWGPVEVWEKVLASCGSPNPSQPLSSQFTPLLWRDAVTECKTCRGVVKRDFRREKKKLNQWLSFEEVCLVQSSERVGKKGASTSSNLSSGDPGGQIGNPVHSLPPTPFVA